MNWKTSLDRYLTTPPDDGFDSWAEKVIDQMPDDFYYKNNDWLNDNDGVCNKWLNKLFDKGRSPQDASNTIQRAYTILKNNLKDEAQQ